MDAQPILEFRHFGFQYDAQAEPTLYDINLTVRPGEKLLIAGPSGSGKSTIAHCINGLIPFSYRGEMTGEVRIDGKPTSALSLFDISKVVGTVLQDSDAQFVGLTVAEDIAFALENNCVSHEEMLSRVAAVAEEVGVSSVLEHAPNEISGGQKQRVSMAGVLVDKVRVLLFDEPLANLDPATGRQAMELIDALQQRTGAAVIIIEHRIEDVLHLDIDRLIIIDDGRIAADASPADILCSDILSRHGLREPLYITALKYAGVALTPEMHPEHPGTLVLSDRQTALVRAWFHAVPSPQPGAAPAPLLEAKDIRFSYPNGKQALDGVSLRLGRGEMLCIVGRNGAGKSTFSKVICGFETQQSGTVTLGGQDLAALTVKERADHIGYVMQNPNQMISKSKIFDEVGLSLSLDGVQGEELERRVYDSLKVCGLYPFRSWPVSALSFGQKKRVTVASMLASDPEIILLDEPTAGQDFRHYTEIMEFLRELNARGVTVVMITHDMHLMLEYAPRAVVFSDGHILADDSPANILTNPDIIEKASLRETSLYPLAVLCGIESAPEFITRFIDYDREVRQK